MTGSKATQEFNVENFLKTVFAAKKGEKLCVLVDLENVDDVKDFRFLKMDGHEAQKKAYEVFNSQGVDFFGYKSTGGNNLELPGEAMSVEGSAVDFKKDIYSQYDIILAVGKFSATAPLTAAAREYGFRGASMPRLNDLVLNSGLMVDYAELRSTTERICQGMTGADSADIEFEVESVKMKLHLYLGDQLAQKNDGICHKKKQFVNLPAGKVYFVPFDAEGSFPMQFSDGTIALMQVGKGRIKKAKLIKGNEATVIEFQSKLSKEKVWGTIGELGFGTVDLPYSGCYAQDGKIFGTFHLGIGRNDHLHGSIGLNRFIDKKNASHDDILFSKQSTPDIKLVKVTLNRNGKAEILIENDEPQECLLNLFHGN